MIRKFITIKGCDYDIWEIKSVEPNKDFPEFADDWEFSIILNREGIATNLNAIKILCESEQDMLDTIKDIKIRLAEDDDIIMFI